MKTKTHEQTQPAVIVYDLDIDTLRRRHKEQRQRGMSGTVEEAVDFFNKFGQYERHGVTTTELGDEYFTHLKRCGVTKSYLHRCALHIGRFVKAEPGQIGEVQPLQIDNYLKALSYWHRLLLR